MPGAWNVFRSARIMTTLKANSVSPSRSDVSGNIRHARTHTHAHAHRLLRWNEYVIEIWCCAADPAQDWLALSLSLSHSVCCSDYLLTKELSLCLSGLIVLNRDSLCNHLIIHQFPKKPQRGFTFRWCWRAPQWETGEGRGEAFQEEMIKMDFCCFTCDRYLHLVWFQLCPLMYSRNVSYSQFTSPLPRPRTLGTYKHKYMQPGFAACTVCSGGQREREHQLAYICIGPYGDWNSDWIGFCFFSPLAVPGLCMTNLLH